MTNSNLTSAETESLRTFFAAQVAKCERGLARGNARIRELDAKGLRYGDAGWTDRCIAGAAAVEMAVGCRGELAYWHRRQTEHGF